MSGSIRPTLEKLLVPARTLALAAWLIGVATAGVLALANRVDRHHAAQTGLARVSHLVDAARHQSASYLTTARMSIADVRAYRATGRTGPGHPIRRP